MATSGFTYLTTDELSERIKYNVRTIRERMLDSVLIEGVHYIRPFGGRKILFLWEKIENDMAQASSAAPFSGGRFVCIKRYIDSNDQGRAVLYPGSHE